MQVLQGQEHCCLVCPLLSVSNDDGVHADLIVSIHTPQGYVIPRREQNGQIKMKKGRRKGQAGRKGKKAVVDRNIGRR